MIFFFFYFYFFLKKIRLNILYESDDLHEMPSLVSSEK